jgi:hypothetical protein
MVTARIVGVHPIKAREPVHLVELEILGHAHDIDWASFTQPIEGKDHSYWQVPYDERPLPDRPNHWCFFFHYLDLQKPMRSCAGDLQVPMAEPLPSHLAFIKYEEP